MSGVRITIEGDDAALAASRVVSRIITFPDGQARHISLENRLWTILERLHTVKGWDADEVTNLSYKAATDYYAGTPEFEERLRYTFEFLLKINTAYAMKDDGDWQTANDDGVNQNQAYGISLRSIFRRAAIRTWLH